MRPVAPRLPIRAEGEKGGRFDRLAPASFGCTWNGKGVAGYAGPLISTNMADLVQSPIVNRLPDEARQPPVNPTSQSRRRLRVAGRSLIRGTKIMV